MTNKQETNTTELMRLRDEIEQLESEKAELKRQIVEWKKFKEVSLMEHKHKNKKLEIAVEALKEVRESLNNQSGIHWRDIVHNALARIEHGEPTEEKE